MRFKYLLILSAITAISAGCTVQDVCFGIQSADKMICAVSRDYGISAKQMAQLASQAARERGALVRYFGNDVGPVTVIIRDTGIAYHEPPSTIYLSSRHISNSHAITAHEMTHLLTQGWASRVLKEGLAVYAQYRFGEQQGWPNYKRSVHVAARRWLADDQNDIQSLQDSEPMLRTRQGNRRQLLAAYSLSGSWVMWIIEEKLKGDVAAFMKQLYRSGRYQSTLRQSRNQLEKEWRQFVLDGT